MEKKISSSVVGMAMFSMFFGAGNLIFPLFLGVLHENNFWLSALGFSLTGVILPILGVFSLVLLEGKYERLVEGVLPKKLSPIFFLLILCLWIPFGSGPRCVVLAHASLETIFDDALSLWLFSPIFLSLVFLVLSYKNKIIDVIGKYLTPLLLLSILLLVVFSIYYGELSHNSVDLSSVFSTSFVQGYYTQDLIASIFFSSSIIILLDSKIKDKRTTLNTCKNGGLIAGMLLAIIYFSLMAASAFQSSPLQGVGGEKLVSYISVIALGPKFGSISSLLISIACFTTEVALVLVFGDFINKNIFASKRQNQSYCITIFVILAMSFLKFDGIMAILSPAMNVVYPILLLLVFKVLFKAFSKKLT